MDDVDRMGAKIVELRRIVDEPVTLHRMTGADLRLAMMKEGATWDEPMPHGAPEADCRYPQDFIPPIDGDAPNDVLMFVVPDDNRGADMLGLLAWIMVGAAIGFALIFAGYWGLRAIGWVF